MPSSSAVDLMDLDLYSSNREDGTLAAIRSADPVHLSNFQSAGEGMAEFFETGKWSDVAARIRHRMSRRPYESALAAFSMFALFAANRRVKQKLEIRDHESSA